MTQHTNRASAFKRPRSPTISGLMSLIFFVAIGLWLVRPAGSSFSGPAVLLTLAYIALWIAAPFIVKRQWTTADPRYEPVDLQSEETPEAVTGSVAAISPEMEAVGFRKLGQFRISKSVPSGGAYVTLFENRRSRQYAKLFTAIVGSRQVRRVETTLAFFTEFTDGSILVTGNNKTRPLTPRVRVHIGSMAFPWVRDPRRLHEIHDACVARFGSDAIRLEIAIQDPVEFLRKSHLRETDKNSENGYYYLDEEDAVYRPTWRGAILMAWKLLWPIKPIRAMLARRRSTRVLRELGMEP